ncbi:hypothetical protein, partial [Silanimonas sp.]|uniref:beta strand repeat-containing protein n=1 Tax=Silanimonas sp. TaxID=1929290 RepID=UPI0022C98341
ENGEIVIDGGENGIVSVNGLVNASGNGADARGGNVTVLGEKVGLFENARVDVSGAAGGGQALIGGNYLGRGPEPNAKMVYMDARAVIDASATANGDGGRVILWSDEVTRNAGHIDVSGANNGGFVEVSSKGHLDFRGTVNLRGLAGRAGHLLLDPNDITIGGTDTNITNTANTFGATGAGASVISLATLYGALASGAVTVQTASGSGGNGDITIASTIAYSGVASSLTLLADRDIIVDYGISSTNALNVTLNALRRVQVNANIAAAGGDILIKANVATWTTPGVTAPVFGTAAGSFDGVAFASGVTATTTGTGNIWIAGKGGTAAGRGVAFNDGSGVTAGGTGSIAIVGASTTGMAIDMYRSTPANAIVATGGSVSLVGDNGSGGDADSDGVLLNGVGITASGNISVTGRGGASVGNGLNIANGAYLTSTGGGTISILGESANGGATGINTVGGGTISTTGAGAISFTSNKDVSIGGNVATGTGGVSLTTTGAVAIGGTLTTAGTVTINADGTVTQTAAILGSGALVLGGTGGITLTNASNAFGSITVNRAAAVTQTILATTITPNVQTSSIGTGQFALTGQGFTQSGTITQAAGGGTVTIAGGTGAVTLSQANTWTGAVTVTGQTIDVTDAQTATGAGSFVLDATRNVVIGADITTATGDIRIEGNVASWAPSYATNAPVFGTASGNFIGVEITGNVTSSGGNIAIAGKGGDSSSYNHGVVTTGSPSIAASGAGTVTIHGQGGPSTTHVAGNGAHIGVNFGGGSISTVDGTLKVVGTGGGAGTTDNNAGVQVFNTFVGSNGLGNVVVAATGGNGGSRGYVGAGTFGVYAQNGTLTLTGVGGTGYYLSGDGYNWHSTGVEVSGGSVINARGAGLLSVTGTGGGAGTGANVVGVSVSSGGLIKAEGTGGATIVGTGGNGSGAGNHGVVLNNSNVESTGSGGLLVTGTAGVGTGPLGLSFAGASVTVGGATHTGNTTLRADSISNTATTLTLSRQAGGGTITFRTDTDATTMGVAGGTGTLQVTAALLSTVSGFQTQSFGSATQTGAINLAGITLARDTTVAVNSAGVYLASDGNPLALNGRTLTVSSITGNVVQSGGITGAGTL